MLRNPDNDTKKNTPDNDNEMNIVGNNQKKPRKKRGFLLYLENPALDAGFSVAYSDELVKALQLG